MAADTPPGLWVRSDLTPQGTYVTTVEYGQDLVLPLTRTAAHAYALAILAACQYAAYDAAVWKQMTEVSGKTTAAAELVVDLRADRPDINDKATRPLRFEPFVSAITRQPGIFLWFAGEKVAQLDLPDAEQHAVAVLNASIVVDLDAAYLRLLRGPVGVDEHQARSVVDDLSNYREAHHG